MGKVFAGDTICVSGHFSCSQSEMSEIVIKNGAHISKTPNRNCTYLVCDQMGSAKTAKAEKDGIDIVTESWVRDSIEAGKKLTDKKYFLSGGSGGSSSSGSKKGKKAADDDEEEDEEEEEEEEEKPKKKSAPKKASSQVFEGEVFCVSGNFSITQAEMRTLITKNGGDIVDTPNKKCTFLVSDQIGSAKTMKAQKDGIDIVTEEWVNVSIAAGTKSVNPKHFLSGGGAAASSAGDDEDEEEEEKPKKKSAPKRKKPSEDDEDDADADDADLADDAPKKSSKKSASSGPSSKSTSSGSGTSEPKIKKVVVKGSAPVDDLCPKHSTHHVYQEGSNVYDAMLNQTNIGGNNNKYYIVQLLESDSTPKSYSVWTRWGRVGLNGQNAIFGPYGDVSTAKGQFDLKFHDKTKNHWANRANFVTYSGKYTLLDRDYSADDDQDEEMKDGGDDGDDDNKSTKSMKTPDSKLDKRVQDLIKLICDLKMMKDAMIEVGYDANKMPLGKLSKDHIQKGYSVLKEIAEEIDDGANRSTLVELSNRFYTLIPHIVGMKPPPIINNVKLLKEKLTLVESLSEAVLATSLLRTSSVAGGEPVNPVDQHYEKLKCDFTPVDKQSKEFEMVQDYTKNTHGHTHNQYKLEVLDVFALDREGESKRYDSAGFDKVHNKMLLWHGSRLTNFCGIISQGLRIAPPEAPVTGYMFGKGVYFADMVSKSANYCAASRSSDVQCMLLCEVALGDMNELKQADYHASNLPAGKLSTKGLGANYPDPAKALTLDSGVVVPLGPEKKDHIPGSSLLYNEFIVYNVSQIKCKYLVKMKFKY